MQAKSMKDEILMPRCISAVLNQQHFRCFYFVAMLGQLCIMLTQWNCNQRSDTTIWFCCSMEWLPKTFQCMGRSGVHCAPYFTRSPPPWFVLATYDFQRGGDIVLVTSALGVVTFPEYSLNESLLLFLR